MKTREGQNLLALEQGVLASTVISGDDGTDQQWNQRLSRDPRVGMFTPKALDMG